MRLLKVLRAGALAIQTVIALAFGALAVVMALTQPCIDTAMHPAGYIASTTGCGGLLARGGIGPALLALAVLALGVVAMLIAAVNEHTHAGVGALALQGPIAAFAAAAAVVWLKTPYPSDHLWIDLPMLLLLTSLVIVATSVRLRRRRTA